MCTLKCFLLAFIHQLHIFFSDSVKMAYAEDRLYNEVIRKKMGDLASKVKVREIVSYLQCLTLSDRVMYATHCTNDAFKLCVLNHLFVKR